MPFADEISPVHIVEHQPRWHDDFLSTATELSTLSIDDEGSIDHIGSTAVPGLLAKDVIDVQIRVARIDEQRLTHQFDILGYRRRPEPWNNLEATRTGEIAKVAFAPPKGARPSNVHVRCDGTTGASDALLFRDFLRHDDRTRDAWGAFKATVAGAIPDGDLMRYGQVKQPAWILLMSAADAWAERMRWQPPAIAAWPTISP